MKKFMNKINFAIVAAMASAPAFAAGSDGLCQLIYKLKDIFDLLRTLAFVGAAFYIAGWAWGYISKGEAKMDDVKNKGTGLLVGFVLLFSVGLILTFISSYGEVLLECNLGNW